MMRRRSPGIILMLFMMALCIALARAANSTTLYLLTRGNVTVNGSPKPPSEAPRSKPMSPTDSPSLQQSVAGSADYDIDASAPSPSLTDPHEPTSLVPNRIILTAEPVLSLDSSDSGDLTTSPAASIASAGSTSSPSPQRPTPVANEPKVEETKTPPLGPEVNDGLISSIPDPHDAGTLSKPHEPSPGAKWLVFLVLGCTAAAAAGTMLLVWHSARYPRTTTTPPIPRVSTQSKLASSDLEFDWLPSPGLSSNNSNFDTLMGQEYKRTISEPNLSSRATNPYDLLSVSNGYSADSATRNQVTGWYGHNSTGSMRTSIPSQRESSPISVGDDTSWKRSSTSTMSTVHAYRAGIGAKTQAMVEAQHRAFLQADAREKKWPQRASETSLFDRNGHIRVSSDTANGSRDDINPNRSVSSMAPSSIFIVDDGSNSSSRSNFSSITFSSDDYSHDTSTRRF